MGVSPISSAADTSINGSRYDSPGMRRVPRTASNMATPAANRSGGLRFRTPAFAVQPPANANTTPRPAASTKPADPGRGTIVGIPPQPSPSRPASHPAAHAADHPASRTAQRAAIASSRPAAAVAGEVSPSVAHVHFNHDADAAAMRRQRQMAVAVTQFELPFETPQTQPPPRPEPLPRPGARPGNSLRDPSSLRDLAPKAPQFAPEAPRFAPEMLPAAPEPQPVAPETERTPARPERSPLSDLMQRQPPTPQTPSQPESSSDRQPEFLPLPGRDRDIDDIGDIGDEFENPFDDNLRDIGPEGTRSRGTRDPMNTDSQRDDGLGVLDAADAEDVDDSLDDSLEDGLFDMDDQRGDEDDSLTCEQFRRRIASRTIDQVSLDLSPPYRPDEINLTKYEKLRQRFDDEQQTRTFRNIVGAPLATGRFVDLAYGQVVLATDRGEVRVNQSELSEADLAYITDAFGLPNECLLRQETRIPRNWIASTVTWRASNLCHNPLYFQDVNLERYGHTHGPLAEPLIQSAHFFGSVLVLPYKMGVHHPKECIYALGYYRPGNCAPWIIPPVPISARGILNQAAVMTAGTLLIP